MKFHGSFPSFADNNYFCFHCFTLGTLNASNLRKIRHILLLGPDIDCLICLHNSIWKKCKVIPY
jgi:hypothetical protein